MSDLQTLINLFADTIDPIKGKNAEQQLRSVESKNDNFILNLFRIISLSSLPLSIRLAASIFLKNFLKVNWIDENGNHLLAQSNINIIKQEIISLMISLPEQQLQIQIGESISIIADSDFPHNWQNLINDLVSKLSIENMNQTKSILLVSHSIFKKWRPLFRSDELFLEIKIVLDAFSVPFLNLLKNVDEKISNIKNDNTIETKDNLTLLFDILLLLIKLYYDFNCQDIPEFFEDNIKDGMGILHKYLSYENPLVDDPNEDDDISILIKVKSSIQEVVQLYTTRYEDIFDPMINDFIQVTWQLLTKISTQPKNDILVAKSLNFLTAIIRIPKFFEFFNSNDTMNDIMVKVILPNVILRDSDIELFEDDPIEYIRRDLENSDYDTRRKSSTNFLNELKIKNENLTTNILLKHIEDNFKQYSMNQQSNWKYKDLCTYLFSSLAMNGNLTSIGVTNTNKLVNILDFFTNHIYQDLTGSVVHPILKVDAIKYIYTFRNQLNKAQLIEILPILASFLESDEFVLYTYSAITIERILSIREGVSSSTLIFNKSDLSNSSNILLTNFFKLIMKQNSSPEKLAENEFLMKAVFRVLQTAEDSIQPMFSELLSHLISIVSLMATNPSNPRFSHYTFESIGAIVKYTSPENIISFLDSVMPTFLHILSEDIQEFTPYVLQIVAFAIEKINSVPPSVQQLSQPILSPTVWELKGNIPAVTRLLSAIVKANYQIYSDFTPVLGVFQRLIASKSYDIHGFELLEVIMTSVPVETLRAFLKQIAVLLLQRLQSSKTEKYVKKLTVFVGILSIKLGADFVIQFIDDVQDGIFTQIWSNFIINTLPTLGNLLDRKLALAGIVKFITNSQLFSTKYAALMPVALEKIIITTTSQNITNLKNDQIDLDTIEEIATFGSTYSKLISISSKPFDPIPDIDAINGINNFVARSLKNFNITSNNALFSGVASQLSDDLQMKLNQLISSS